jgi:RHS repeat-associated protein
VQYDAYGKITSQTNVGNQPRFGFAGRDIESVGGMTYNRNRYYSTSSGRFISQDPIGFNAGDENLYRYVGNSPTNARDPSGLFEDGPEGPKIVTLTKNEVQSAVDAEFKELIGELKSQAQKTASDFAQDRTEARRNAAIAKQILSDIKEEEKQRVSRGLLQDSRRREQAVVNLDASASMVIEPYDWYLTAQSIYNHPEDWTSYVGMVPFVPGALGKLIRAADDVPTSIVKEVDELTDTARGGPYGHLGDHPSVNSGKPFTQSQKQKILAENEARNGGELLDDLTGEALVRPQQHTRGVRPPDNEAQVDHVYPRCEGGPNTFSNAEVRARIENIKKGSKIE